MMSPRAKMLGAKVEDLRLSMQSRGAGTERPGLLEPELPATGADADDRVRQP